MTEAIYTFNNDPVYYNGNVSAPVGGHYSGSVTVDFASDTVVASTLTFTPVSSIVGPVTTIGGYTVSLGPPPGGGANNYFVLGGLNDSYDPVTHVVSTGSGGYFSGFNWAQSLGLTPPTVQLGFLAENSSFNAATGLQVTGLWFLNTQAPVSAQILSSAPGPVPGVGLPVLALLVVALVATKARGLLAR